MKNSHPSGNELRKLLQETVGAHVSPAAHVVEMVGTALQSGMSGARVLRHHLTLVHPSGSVTGARLVTKEADLRERRVLIRLTEQRQPAVPFSHTLDLATDGPALVCMQDVGDTRRPTSLEPITEQAVEREAEGLAVIHSVNMESPPAWLPRMAPDSFADRIINGWWRPHWDKVVRKNEFTRAFGPSIAPVEAAAARLRDDLSLLASDADSWTLIHGDINPSNVLVDEGRPYYIDWQVAQYGPLYLDLPHHFCTLSQAEQYRQALTARGVTIPNADFEERYRLACRVIGFRYMWWTLEAWLADPSDAAWVQHYVNLILR